MQNINWHRMNAQGNYDSKCGRFRINRSSELFQMIDGSWELVFSDAVTAADAKREAVLLLMSPEAAADYQAKKEQLVEDGKIKREAKAQLKREYDARRPKCMLVEGIMNWHRASLEN